MKRQWWRTPHPFVCLAILLAVLAWAAWRGEDTNWDLQNYHRFDAFALLHAREARDVAPAGPQSFLNPAPYLLPYGLDRLLPPLAAGLLVAASQSLGLMLAWAIAWTLSRRLLPSLLATCVACTGAVVLSELGTSFADLVLAAPPLGSILLMLRAPPLPERGALPERSAIPGLLLAGALTGAAIGIKPTSLFLLPPLLVFGAMRQGHPSQGAKAAILLIAGAGLGGILSDGAWALTLWRQYGSPVFPFMNTVFRAASAARVDFGDPRFHFMGWRHAIAIPAALATGSASTGEISIRDGRLVFALLLGILRLAGRALLPRRSRRFDPLDAACGFILIGVPGWLVLCPIQRYAAVLEILSGLTVILLLARLPGRTAPLLATLLASILLIGTTRPADYFHRPWSAASRLRVPPGIPPDATYGLLAQPLAEWVTIPPRPAHSFGLTSTLLQTGGVLQRRLDAMLRASGGRLWLLSFDTSIGGQVREEMRIHGIVMAPPCLRAASLFWINTVFCRGIVAAPRRLAASYLHPGDQVTFSTAGYGLIYELGGFGGTDPDATWAIGRDAALGFHLDPAARSAGLVLSIHLAGMVGARARSVTITAAGGRPDSVRLGAPSYFANPTLCIPPGGAGDNTVEVGFSTDNPQSPAQLHLGSDPRPLAFKLYAMSLRLAHPGECP